MMKLINQRNAHQNAIRVTVADMAKVLNAGMGPSLVAFLGGAKDRKQATRWANGTTARTDAEARLRAAFLAWTLIEGSEGAAIARAWFIGSNPDLAGKSPVAALREAGEHNTEAVTEAAHAFLEGM